MKNALQDQLLKAGLATEKQVNKANAEIKKKNKQAPKKPKAERNKPVQSDLAEAYTARRKAEQQEHAEAQRLAAQKKANRALVKQLIKDHSQNKKDAPESFQFVIGSNVKKVYVTTGQKKQLVNGELGITFQGGARCLIPAKIIEKIRELDPDKTIFMNEAVESKSDSDDYDDFEVPDDLDW